MFKYTGAKSDCMDWFEYWFLAHVSYVTRQITQMVCAASPALTWKNHSTIFQGLLQGLNN